MFYLWKTWFSTALIMEMCGKHLFYRGKTWVFLWITLWSLWKCFEDNVFYNS